jgi:hypothetical protein
MASIRTYSKEFIQNRPKGRSELVFEYLASDRGKNLLFLSLFLLLALPLLFIPTAFVTYFLLKYHSGKIGRLPFFLPVTSRKKADPFNPSPNKDANGKSHLDPAAGIAFFGNVDEDNRQVWFSDSMLRQHVAFLASTGSGKTFTIAGIACINALLWGAGYLYIDAKADLDIVRMHQTPAWRMNRLDDVFVLNYIQGSRNVWDAYAGDKQTNTYNILESGTPAQNTETMKSLMDGDKDIWSKRADALLAGLISPTTYMRDKNMITLSVLSFLDYLTIENAGAIIGNAEIPDFVKKSLAGFIKTLPGMSAPFYEEIIQGKSIKSTQVYDQWGFASMQIILVINMLAGDYGRIFGVTVGEINLEAIALQDRILIGLLPALEASSQSVASMGRIIMAARKGMMGRALGETIEGSVKENLKQRPTNAPYPYINVMDEVGMIFSEGEGASAAQARGIGYSLWYSAQDIPAMKKLSDQIAKEVMTVLGNTIIKICGRIIDDETFEEYSKLFDEEYVWQRDRTDMVYTSSGSPRATEASGSYTKQKRLDKRVVQKLREGEMFISAVDELHKVNGPNLHPESIDTLMLNDFVPMLPYPQEILDNIRREKIYLKAEYEQIVSGREELNVVKTPAYTQLPALRSILDTVSNFVKNDCSANHLAFSTFTRCATEAVREQAMDRDEKLEKLAKIARKANTVNAAQADEDEDEVIEPTYNNVIDIEIKGSKRGNNTEHVNEKEDAVKASTEKKLSVLDAQFKAMGLSRDALASDMAEINALASRADELTNAIQEQVVTRDVAHVRMQEVVTNEERNYNTASSSKTIADLYAKTDHPGGPNPEANKALTINLLRSIYQELKRSDLKQNSD